MKSELKILILAGDTDGNLGDRAIILSMCEELRRIRFDIQIQLISNDPDGDREIFDATMIPRGPAGLPSLVKAIKESDLILCGGGGLFQDDSSLVKMPYWAMRLALVKLLGGSKIVGYSLGVGPLRHISSRIFARFAFLCMERISVRDPEANKTSIPLTKKAIQIVPDPALLLPAASKKEAYRLLQQSAVPVERPLVGVAVRRWFHQYSGLIPHKHAYQYNIRRIPGEDKCRRMTSFLALVLDRLVQEHGAHIVFMPTYNVPHEADDHICRETIKKMHHRSSTLLKISDPRLYKAVTGLLSVMLGGRLHPAILAADMGTPIVGLAYNQKFLGFFDLLGIRDKVIWVEDFLFQERTEELTTLLSEGMMSQSKPMPKILELKESIRRFNHDIFRNFFDPPVIGTPN